MRFAVIPKVSIEKLCKKWHLADLRPLSKRSFSTVYQATRTTDQIAVILKIGADIKSIEQEALTLRSYNAKSAAILYDVDETNCAILIELVSPGTDLKVLFPDQDDQAIQITSQVIKELHTAPLLDKSSLPTLQAWLGNFSYSSHIPASMLEKAKKLSTTLIASTQNTVLLHGDLHHENILKSDSRGYLAIDPKGIVGDAAYEVVPFLCNPLPEILHHPTLSSLWKHRTRSFSSLLCIDENRLRLFCFVHAVAAATWAIEDRQDHDPWLKLAEIFMRAS
jgi:streptomycin 6-kinase